MLITSSFIIINVGQYVGSADGEVFQRSEMDKMVLQQGPIHTRTKDTTKCSPQWLPASLNSGR